MKFFPSENIVYRTKLPAEEVAKRLSKNIEPVTNDWGRVFAGSIRGNEFEVRRNINYRNSFQAEITGTITNVNGQTFVNVKMELIRIIKNFTIFLCLFAGVIFGLIIYVIITSGHFTPIIFFPLFFIAFAWILSTASFQADCSKSKKELEKIIESESAA